MTSALHNRRQFVAQPKLRDKPKQFVIHSSPFGLYFLEFHIKKSPNGPLALAKTLISLLRAVHRLVVITLRLRQVTYLLSSYRCML